MPAKTKNRWTLFETHAELSTICKNEEYIIYIDIEDYDKVKTFTWCIQNRKKDNTVYVRHGSNLYLHRFIMNTPNGFQTDHINKNGLDNRKYNLRNVTMSANLKNQTTKRNLYNSTGVTLEGEKVWRCSWSVDGKQHRKAFAISNYGYDEARRLAIEYRNSKTTEENGYLNER